jgi:hypothetical protein
VVKPCNLRRSLLFKEIAILAVPRSPCLQNPLSMTAEASSMAPAVPDRRRVGATVPGPRRVAIISGPTGGRRCHRYGALLKRRPRVRSSRSRFGSSSGTPGTGVARELPFKSHFKGEAKSRSGSGHVEDNIRHGVFHDGCKAFIAHDWPQITPCRGPRRQSAGMPGNQRRDPLGKRFGFPPAYGSTERGRRRPTRCFLLLT